jgi:hypothetical protein
LTPANTVALQNALVAGYLSSGKDSLVELDNKSVEYEYETVQARGKNSI